LPPGGGTLTHATSLSRLTDEERTETTLKARGFSEQEGQGSQGGHLVGGVQASHAPSRSGSSVTVEHEKELPPLFRLPDEILVEIVKHGIQTDADDGSSSFEKTMSHVSMRWRTVVISHPSLWTRVSVCPNRPPSFLQTLIHRSADMPIDIDIYPWPIQPTRAAPHSLLVRLNLILRSAKRWRSLTIRCGRMEQMFNFVLLYFLRYGTYLPALECVTFRGWEMQAMPWSRALFFDERCTPSLSTLRVDNMKIHTMSLNSWTSTITTLVLTRDIGAEMTMMTFRDFILVPSSFPSLASLVIYGLVVDIPLYPSFTNNHQYPALRTLAIHRINDARFSSLIMTLALMFPGITHLNLTGPQAAASLLVAIRQVSADELWSGLQKLVLNDFAGHEWSQIHRYLETSGDRKIS
jgi:hypothetical protein